MTIDEIEAQLVLYGDMINSIVHDIVKRQLEVNTNILDELTKHVRIFSIHHEIVKDLQSANKAFRALMAEHEARLVKLERYVSSDCFYIEAPKKPVEN